MFLKMLTAQMQNQDPLNPIDSTDYATQLATFSGVEQQTRTNQLLEGMGGQIGMNGLAQLAGWVGMEARTEAGVAFDGASPVSVAVTPRLGANRATLVATDAAGTVVGRQDIAPDAAEAVWSGIGIDGRTLNPGTYALSVETSLNGSAAQTAPAAHYARVLEVRSGTDGNRLILEGGAEVAAADVTALRGR